MPDDYNQINLSDEGTLLDLHNTKTENSSGSSSGDKTCKQCGNNFKVEKEDLEFYDKISPTFAGKKYQIPAPCFCPDCRQQRRLAWRGERNFYNRTCDSCGKNIITVFAPDDSYKIFCPDCWWSDKWETKDYAKELDFTKPFFKQFEELLKTVPILSSWNINNENSEYNNNISFSKNCYLISSSNHDEECYYGYYLNDSKDCLDNTYLKKSELMYECIECIDCYNLKYSQNCTNCKDSWFLKNCISCTNCFGSANLRHKEYYFLNQQLSKEEYEKKMAEFHSGNLKDVQEMIKLVNDHQQKFPSKFMTGEQNENVTGNGIFQSKNALSCFDSVKIEDSKYCYQMQEAKNCYDMMTWGRPAEYVYECMAVGGNAYMNGFTAISQESSNNYYCYLSMFSKNLFGCVSIKKGEYCILNKQYSKEEYEQLIPKIIEHMKSTGEWGEFFPTSISPFAYNEALSNDFMSLTKEEALKQGHKWKDIDKKEYQPQIYQVPADISEIDQKIVKEILACKLCGKNYKIIPQEFVFYKTHKLAIPEICPSCRHLARMKKRNPRHLWHRDCMCEETGHNHEGKCKNEFETTYAPDRPEKVYCESCYQKSVL